MCENNMKRACPRFLNLTSDKPAIPRGVTPNPDHSTNHSITPQSIDNRRLMIEHGGAALLDMCASADEERTRVVTKLLTAIAEHAPLRYAKWGVGWSQRDVNERCQRYECQRYECKRHQCQI